VPFRLPVPQRAWIDSQSLRHLSLGQAEFSAGREKALGKRTGLRERVISKEPDDGRHVANDRGGFIAFPVCDRGSVDTNLIRNLPLKEFQVQTAGADMVA
jgi:hypothetical protein